LSTRQAALVILCQSDGIGGEKGNLSAYFPVGTRSSETKHGLFLDSTSNSGTKPVQPLHCLRCRREIEVGDKSVAVYMFAQTVGVKPRQKSTAQRICFCPQCAVSLAMGMPPEGALNMAAWEMIRDLVSAEPSLNQAAWESLRGVAALLTSGSEESQTVNWRVASRRAG
jgi:hypothetical protein